MSKNFMFSALVLFLVFISCEKEAGEGGTSSISGKVIIKQYNSNFTILVEQYYATDEDVFIVYDNDKVYSDKTTTNYDGTYQFDYLRKGQYTIFAYSKDSANYPTKHEIAVIKKVQIDGRRKDIKVPDIVILK